MFTLVVRIAGRHDTTLAFDTTELTIGRADTNDLVLGRKIVSRFAARIIVTDAVYIFNDTRAVTGTFVNGERIVGQHMLIEGDRFTISGVELELVAIAPTRVNLDDAVEERLVGLVISADSNEDRLVYADWLESNGRPERAEYLRLAIHDTDPERLAELAHMIPRPWRALITAPPIEQCTTAACPARWDRLPRGERDYVRRCATCARDIVFCSTAYEAARKHGPIAVDPAALRIPGDLDENGRPIRPVPYEIPE